MRIKEKIYCGCALFSRIESLFLCVKSSNVIMVSTLNRYIWLLNTLIQAGRLTYQEINQRWQRSSLSGGQPLPLRTFHMHRNAVEELFQINISCDASDGYTYYIEGLSELRTDKLRQWLLNAFSVSEMMMESQWIRERILLEEIPSGTEYLRPIVDAMRQSRILRVEYQPFYEEESASYRICPYCLKVYRLRWYLLGDCEELGGLRHFALDRIHHLEMAEEPFDYPSDFSPEAYYKDSVGIWVNEKIQSQKVLIRAYGLESKYLRSLPLHFSQTEVQTTDTYSDFAYQLCVTTNLIHELLEKGDRIEVLEPESLREEMRSYISRMFNRYEK